MINSKKAEAMPIVLLFTSIALSKSGLFKCLQFHIYFAPT